MPKPPSDYLDWDVSCLDVFIHYPLFMTDKLHFMIIK